MPTARPSDRPLRGRKRLVALVAFAPLVLGSKVRRGARDGGRGLARARASIRQAAVEAHGL
eukprot:1344757-Lingulodinium_polyedra.AAC.1